MKTLIWLLLVAVPIAGLDARQDDQPPPADPPPPPTIREPMPPKVQDPDEQIAPEVVIRQQGERRIEEYRAGGVTYMIRVVPAVGPAYYLFDIHANGRFDPRHEYMHPVRPAHWKLIEW